MHGLSTLTVFTFTNGGISAATVQDSVGNIYLLPRAGQRGSSMDCKCYNQAGQGYLVCDATITPVMMSGNIATSDHLFGDSCLTVSSASNNFDVRYPTCAYKYCTACFLLDTGSNDVALELTYCSYYYSMDQSSVGILQYHFTNTGANMGTVSDGTNVYTLAGSSSGQSSMICTCSSNLFLCSSSTVRATSASTGVAAFPEALSVKSFTKLGSYLRLNDQQLQFSTDANTYAEYNSGIQFYVGGTRKLSMTSSKGQLHGTWESDGVVTSSDARLKREIQPLRDTVARLQQRAASSARPAGSTAQGLPETLDPVHWLLMQLKPVSYIALHDETGGTRFGFLADDLEKVVPDMVRHSDDEARTKRVYLMDMVSLLVANAQQQYLALKALEASCNQRHGAHEERLRRVEQAVERLASRLGAEGGA